jgi:hypothetical protein
MIFMISHKNKYIFIHIPKCAGTSVEKALGQDDDGIHKDIQDHRTIRQLELPVNLSEVLKSRKNFYQYLLRIQHNTTRFNTQNNVSQDQYTQYYKFTIVRNPWTRAWSWYQNVMRDQNHQRRMGITSQTSFEQFIFKFAGKGMLRSQLSWLQNYRGDLAVDDIYRFEDLQQAFHNICKKLAIKHRPLPHTLQGKQTLLSKQYSKELKDYVATVYADEIKLFNYWFPS